MAKTSKPRIIDRGYVTSPAKRQRASGEAIQLAAELKALSERYRAIVREHPELKKLRRRIKEYEHAHHSALQDARRFRYEVVTDESYLDLPGFGRTHTSTRLGECHTLAGARALAAGAKPSWVRQLEEQAEGECEIERWLAESKEATEA